jgi:2-polyprenyl-3-methyl-5-hydroxy-6-metoxy-1,4-benzoquinol methylase
MSFAKLYDQLMEDIDYEEIYAFIKPYIINFNSIIDAGCGSGYLTTLLAKDFNVIGLDNDDDMLVLARNRLEEHGVKAKLYMHDLSEAIPLKADAIIACFDVLNYFENIESVIHHFYESLNNQGLLIFDIYKEEILDIYQNYREIEEEPFPYTWFVKVDGNEINHHITVNQDTYDIKQYVHRFSRFKDALEALGCHVDMIDGPDERKHYIIATKIK